MRCCSHRGRARWGGWSSDLTGVRAVAFQSQAISPALEGRDIRVTGVIAAMPQWSEAGVRFRLGVESALLDGRPVDFADTVTYRGLMFTGVPNMAYVFGYFRHSWTLRADLISDFVCRLLHTLQEKGASRVVPALRPEDRDMPLGPWVDPENFNPGYLTRSMHLMPTQGDREPWRHLHEYAVERELLPVAELDDGTLAFC